MITNINVKIGYDEIKQVSSIRNLGYHQEAEMKNAEHVNKLCRQLYPTLKRIAKVRQSLTKDATKILIQSLVLGRIDYCNCLLLGTPKYHLNKLQQIQNMSSRVICDLRKFDHISSAMVDLHWLKVNECIIFKVAVFMYKSVTSTAPKYLTNLVIKIHGRPLHSSTSGLLPVSKCNTMLVQNSSFSSIGPRIWNGLPQSIRHATSVDQFKGLLKTFLFKRSYDL